MQPAVEGASPDLEKELWMLQVGSEAEEAEEVTEKSDLDAAAEDRAMPLAFNGLRHEEDIVGEKGLHCMTFMALHGFIILCY